MDVTRSLLKLTIGTGCIVGGLAFPPLLAADGIVWGTILATALASVAAGNTANAIDALIDRKDGDRISLQNQDLTKAVGKAIAAVITLAALQNQGKTHDNLEKIASQATNNWVKIAQQELTQQRYPQLREAKLDQFLTPEEYSLTQDGNLTAEEWQDIFTRLNMAACKGGGFQLPPEVYPQVAELLHTTFPKALRETLKEDFANDGKAFAGLTLQLLTGMKAELTQLRNTNLAVNTAELTQILQQFQQLETQLRGTVAQQQAFFRQISQDIDSGFAEVCQKLGVMETNITALLQNLEKRLDALDEKLTRLEAPRGRSLSKQEYRNRQNVLTQMRTEVESRLTQSIHRAAFVNLGKEQQPQQVQRPWDMSVKVGEQRSVQLPPQTTILDVFDNPTISGNFLILGKPGGGKTTTLLELAQALVERAETDSDAPIPVILELSEWRTVTKAKFPDFWNKEEYDPSIKEWILSQLRSKGVSQEIGEQWIREKELMLLLDGLDELPSERQAKCVRAINQFLDSEFSPLHLVVCSRKEEYENYEEVLHLNGAICLEDLTVEQIQHYFASVNLGEFWESVKDFRDIVSLISQPLFLAITTLAYQQIDVEEWRNCNTEQKSIDYLLGIYRVEMLTRKRTSKWYKTKQSESLVAQNRLIRLAHYLGRTKNTEQELRVDTLQPSILSERLKNNYLYLTLLLSIILCVFISKISLPIDYDISGSIVIVNCLSFIFTLFSTCGILIGALLLIMQGFNVVADIRIDNNNLLSRMIKILRIIFVWIYFIFVCLTFIFCIFIFSKISNEANIYITWMHSNYHLATAVISGIGIAFLFSGLFSESIKPIQRVGINWGVTFNICIGIICTVPLFLFHFILLMVFELSKVLLGEYDLTLYSYLLILSILIGLSFVGGFLCFEEQDLKQQETKTKNMILNSFIVSIILFIVGMFSGIIPSLKFGINVALSNGIILGLIFSLFAGFACIQYFALRLTLWLTGQMPWNITRFLDYCTERLILQRVGNRYRFIHRLVQEHFANLEIQKE